MWQEFSRTQVHFISLFCHLYSLTASFMVIRWLQQFWASHESLDFSCLLLAPTADATVFKSVRTFPRRPLANFIFFSYIGVTYPCLEQWLAKDSRTTTMSVLEKFPRGFLWILLPNKTKSWAQKDRNVSNLRTLPAWRRWVGMWNAW